MTAICWVCLQRRRQTRIDGMCQRCAFAWDVLIAANPIRPRELESPDEARSRLAADSSSRGRHGLGGHRLVGRGLN